MEQFEKLTTTSLKRVKCETAESAVLHLKTGLFLVGMTIQI